MKCVIDDAGLVIARLPDKKAAELVASGKWRYIAKSAWKKYAAKGHKDVPARVVSPLAKWRGAFRAPTAEEMV